MLNEIKPFCRSIGLNRIMVSCAATNPASRKVILNNDGQYEATVHEPLENMDIEKYWIQL